MSAYDNIPLELKKQRAWVNVTDWSKKPMQVVGERESASPTKPETWGDFETAVKNVEDGIYQGIGYVFHDTGLVGIDIDIGFDDEGFLSDTAVEILNKCKSYTEKSRSGRGFHILLHGELPFKGRNNREGVEIYKSSRYFIMTGKQRFFSEIVENQEAIDYVVACYFSEVQKSETGNTDVIYSPVYRSPEEGHIYLQPEYPPIQKGGRNLSLTSLAGQLHTANYPKEEIYRELLYANKQACKPPLRRREIESIVNSVCRYQR